MEDRQYFLSAELAPRLAAIDIGTNSIRLVVAEASRDGTYRILDDEKETTRLGRRLNKTGHLDPEALEESVRAIGRMQQIAQGYQVCSLRAIATCAVREAQDGAAFCERIFDEYGLSIEVVTAENEARLAFRGVQRLFDLAGRTALVVDIGGGSTEIVVASGRMIENVYATPLGAVRITELFGGDAALSSVQLKRLLKKTDRLLRRHTNKPLVVPQLMIGSGGTFTSLATMIMARRGHQDLPIQGYSITHAEVKHLLDRLATMSPKARRNVPGLSIDRTDIIVAGLAIVQRVMVRFGVNVLEVHVGGVRDGLLLEMVAESVGGQGERVHDRAVLLKRFAVGCGVDWTHCQHVSMLATSMFDQLREPCDLDPEDRTILATAAQLQDVGYLINYDRHHKHSFHLILNSALPGFAPRELELIANVARYHRGASPKKKHDHFRKLSPGERRRVRRLAAILRLAVGLDRSHTQEVEDVRLSVHSKVVEMDLVCDELPEVDVWGARRRSALFEREFEVALIIGWQSALGLTIPLEGYAQPPRPPTVHKEEPSAESTAGPRENLPAVIPVKKPSRAKTGGDQ